jgi:hypothetical protein
MFCLTGNTSILSYDFTVPIDVSSGDWELGLLELTTYNSIPNIEENVNDKFYYGNNHITIPEGSYEIEDIEKYIISKLPKNIKFSLKPNNNTLKSELFCSEAVNFEKENSLGKILGFKNKLYKENETHHSELPVDIIKVNSIRVECNITRGSYNNGMEGHIIHEFYPADPPGYKIIEAPRNVIYLPIITKSIHNITISLRDQNGDLINFRGETISVRLHLKRRDGFSI